MTKFLRNILPAAMVFVIAAAPASRAQAVATTNAGPPAAANAPSAPATAPATLEILRLADASRGNLAGVRWTVDIDAFENKEHQLRSMDVKARGYDFLAEFLSPPKVKGQRVLFVERNMWYTKPGVKKPVPISSRQKLVGNAAYGDIAATNYAEDYDATPLADETVDGISCHVFDMKAKTKKSTYDRVKYWVSKDRTVAVKAEYYTVSGMMFKTARFEFGNKVQIENHERPFISAIKISDSVMKENLTSMSFSSPSLDKLSDSTFDVNLLMTR